MLKMFKNREFLSSIYAVSRGTKPSTGGQWTSRGPTCNPNTGSVLKERPKFNLTHQTCSKNCMKYNLQMYHPRCAYIYITMQELNMSQQNLFFFFVFIYSDDMFRPLFQAIFTSQDIYHQRMLYNVNYKIRYMELIFSEISLSFILQVVIVIKYIVIQKYKILYFIKYNLVKSNIYIL